MRNRTKHVAALAAVAIGMLGAPAGAAATEIDCDELDGITGSVSPGFRAALNGNGGTGTYTLAGSGICTYTGRLPERTTATASGSYTNTTCGSGEWRGTMRLDGASWSATLAYVIHFTAMQGQIDVFSVDGQPEQPSSFPPSVQARDYDGLFSITPTAGNCINQDVTQWRFAGEFDVVW